MTIHNVKPLPERTGLDYYSRYILILFLENILWLLDIPIIYNTLDGLNELWDTICNLKIRKNKDDNEDDDYE